MVFPTKGSHHCPSCTRPPLIVLGRSPGGQRLSGRLLAPPTFGFGVFDPFHAPRRRRPMCSNQRPERQPQPSLVWCRSVLAGDVHLRKRETSEVHVADRQRGVSSPSEPSITCAKSTSVMSAPASLAASRVQLRRDPARELLRVRPWSVEARFPRHPTHVASLPGRPTMINLEAP